MGHSLKHTFTTVATAVVATALSCALVLGTSGCTDDDEHPPVDILPSETAYDTVPSETPAVNGSVADYAPSVFDMAQDNEHIQIAPALERGAWSVDRSQLTGLVDATGRVAAADRSLGYVLLDLKTGMMVKFNTDELFYSASSFKAVFACYVLQTAVDTGEHSFDEPLWEVDSSAGGPESLDDIYEYPLDRVINDALVESDNTAYLTLRSTYYDDEAFAAWLRECGVSDELAYDTWYPMVTPADMAKLWLHIDAYLEGNTAGADFLSRCLSRSTVSMVRQAAGPDALVYAKAGWNSDDLDGSGLSDVTGEGAVVHTDSGPFIVVVYSTATYDFDEGEYPRLISDVLDQLFILRAQAVRQYPPSKEELAADGALSENEAGLTADLPAKEGETGEETAAPADAAPDMPPLDSSEEQSAEAVAESVGE